MIKFGKWVVKHRVLIIIIAEIGRASCRERVSDLV